MEAMQDHPPYVTFEEFETEDRNATIEAGHLVSKFTHVAYITPQGSKDRIQRNVDEWFDQLQFEVLQKRFKPEWLTAYKAAYEAWKSGQEPPVQGTDLRMFPLITKMQLKTCHSVNIKSIEDLANCNEEAINRMGMGARELKQKATTFLNSAANNGVAAEQFLDLKNKLEAVIARNEVLEKQVNQLKALADTPAQQTQTYELNSESINTNDFLEEKTVVPAGFDKKGK